MSTQAILLPLFVQVVLTFALGFWLATSRVAAIRCREVRMRDVALREPSWPPRLRQVEYAFLNQFEMPVLFYVLTVLALVTKHGDLVFVLLAWVYVTLRILHAREHVTGNDLRRRGPLFIASAIVLAVMWLIYIVRMLIVWW